MATANLAIHHGAYGGRRIFIAAERALYVPSGHEPDMVLRRMAPSWEFLCWDHAEYGAFQHRALEVFAQALEANVCDAALSRGHTSVCVVGGRASGGGDATTEVVSMYDVVRRRLAAVVARLRTRHDAVDACRATLCSGCLVASGMERRWL